MSDTTYIVAMPASALFKRDQPRSIDRVIDYFGTPSGSAEHDGSAEALGEMLGDEDEPDAAA